MSPIPGPWDSKAEEARRAEHGKLRLKRIRKRITVELCSHIFFMIVLWVSIDLLMGSSFAPFRLPVAGLIVLFAIVPEVVSVARNLKQAQYAVQDMWAFGTLSFDEISRLLTVRQALEDDIQDSKPYIDIMHEQIGGSVTLSGTEVMALIQNLSAMNEQSAKQIDRITHSLDSGKGLNESVQNRVEKNKEVIAQFEIHLGEQTSVLYGHYEKVKELGEEVKSLTGFIDSIAGIAQQTNLLALNAEIEAARAGSAGRGFSVVAGEVRELSKRTTKMVEEMGGKLTSAANKVERNMAEAQAALDGKRGVTELRQLISELNEMQKDFTNSSTFLLNIVGELEKGHYQSVELLSQAMGHIQFHDVMRQRLEQVQIALIQMRDHMQSWRQLLLNPSSSGNLDRTLKHILDSHHQEYKMASQVQAHAMVAGGNRAAESSLPDIELF